MSALSANHLLPHQPSIVQSPSATSAGHRPIPFRQLGITISLQRFPFFLLIPAPLSSLLKLLKRSNLSSQKSLLGCSAMLISKLLSHGSIGKVCSLSPNALHHLHSLPLIRSKPQEETEPETMVMVMVMMMMTITNIYVITITITIMRRTYTCFVKMGTLMKPWKLFTMMHTCPFQLGFTSPSSRHVARPRLSIMPNMFAPTLPAAMYSSRVSSETSWS